MHTPPLAVYTDTDDLDPGPGIELLRNHGFEVRVLETRNPDEIARAAADAVVLLVGYAAVDEQLIGRLPALQMIALLSRGHDNVDLDAATARGIWVSTVADLATEEVSTHAWMLTLALIRRLDFFAGNATRRRWLARPDVLPRRLSELTIGVLGLGRTGLAYATTASRNAARVLAYDIRSVAQADSPTASIECESGGPITRVTLDEVLAGSDVVSLHLPLTPHTEHIINADTLARMRTGAYLVNVSRGALIDDEALVRALDAGRLAGAALDVFDAEPPPDDDPVINHPRVISTPHVAYLSSTTATGYILAQADNVVDWLTTGTPTSPVNRIAGARC